MEVAPILALSVLLQFTAAFLSLNMIRITGRRQAWILIALAISLMGLRRSITLYRVVSGDLLHTPDFSAELVALLISVLMVAGIAYIAPLFKVAQQAEQFRQIVDQVGESILLIDPASGRLLDCNQTACSTLGYTRDELLALHISDIVLDRRDESPEAWRERVDLIRQSGTAFLSEGTQQRKDGSTFPVETSIAYRTYDQSAYLVASARNITERKHLEKELDRQTWELSETSNRLLQQNQLLNGFREIGEMTLASLDLEQVLDTLGEQVIRIGVFRSLMVALVDNKTQSIEVVRDFRCRMENGVFVMGELHYKLTDTCGTRYGVNDDNITAEVARTGQMKVISGFDKRFDKRFNSLNSESKISYFIPVKQGDQVLAVLATGSAAKDKEAMLLRIEAMQPLLNEVAIALEHARLYRELQNSEKQLRQAQKMEAIGQLSAGIAHNFNNMLMGIMGNLHLAQLDASPQQKRCLSDANTSTQKAAEMVRQLLAYSRRERPHAYRPVDLAPVLQETVGICRQTIDRNIAIDVVIEHNVPPISGDANELDQMVMNLCLNARDALGEQAPLRPTLHVELASVSLTANDLPSSLARPGQFARIQISDNGVGMDETTRSRIFDPFFTTKTVDKGTGLGLSTVYGIVKQHDGWIDCQSSPGQGATFSAYLPALSGTFGQVENSDEIPPDLATGTETVLVIDDEEIVRRAALSILQRLGYQTLAAATGLQGLSIYRQRQRDIDLVLLDLNLPDRTGREIYAELRKISATVPIALFTGYTNGQALPAGEPALVIEKPITLEKLSQSVRQALELNDHIAS